MMLTSGNRIFILGMVFLAFCVIEGVNGHAALLPTGRGEIMGTIKAVRFVNPLKSDETAASDDLAVIEVVDGRGQKAILSVNRDTMIRNPQWLIMSVASLKKGREVKAEYRLSDEGTHEAVFIYYYKDQE